MFRQLWSLPTTSHFLTQAKIANVYMYDLKKNLPGSLPGPSRPKSPNMPSQSQDAHPPDLTTFHQFPQLPIEIRTIIWELLLPDPRIVSLEQSRLAKKESTKKRRPPKRVGMKPSAKQKRLQQNRGKWAFQSDAPAPVLLLVCGESHVVASKYYTKTFGSTDGGRPQTWFDFQKDTLYIDESIVEDEDCHQTRRIVFQPYRDFKLEDLALVQHLAIWWNTEHRVSLRTLFCAFITPYFHALETLTIVGSSHELDPHPDPTSKLASHTTLKYLDDVTRKGNLCYIQGHPIPDSWKWFGYFHPSEILPRSPTMDLLALKAAHAPEFSPRLRELHYRVLSTIEGEQRIVKRARLATTTMTPVRVGTFVSEEKLSFFVEEH